MYLCLFFYDVLEILPSIGIGVGLLAALGHIERDIFATETEHSEAYRWRCGGLDVYVP
jgi:hypothetical protein